MSKISSKTTQGIAKDFLGGFLMAWRLNQKMPMAWGVCWASGARKSLGNPRKKNHPWTKVISYPLSHKPATHTVDGRNPANQLRLVVYPINLQGFIHVRWCRISSINSISTLLSILIRTFPTPFIQSPSPNPSNNHQGWIHASPSFSHMKNSMFSTTRSHALPGAQQYLQIHLWLFGLHIRNAGNAAVR